MRVSAVYQLVHVEAVRVHVALEDWLVAEVQAPDGHCYADVQQEFAVGSRWPLAQFPNGYRLLGYLDPREALTF